jgi:hypothetical protein
MHDFGGRPITAIEQDSSPALGSDQSESARFFATVVEHYGHISDHRSLADRMLRSRESLAQLFKRNRMPQ